MALQGLLAMMQGNVMSKNAQETIPDARKDRDETSEMTSKSKQEEVKGPLKSSMSEVIEGEKKCLYVYSFLPFVTCKQV